MNEKKANCSLCKTFNYGMGYVRNIHAASTKFLSCWLHHKLRLQRPMAASRPMCGSCQKGAKRMGILRRVITAFKK